MKTTTAPVVRRHRHREGKEILQATASLNAKFDAMYTAKGTADDGTRRYPHMPADIGFIPKPIFRNGHGRPIDETPGGDALRRRGERGRRRVPRETSDFSQTSAVAEVGSAEGPFIVSTRPASRRRRRARTGRHRDRLHGPLLRARRERRRP